MKWTRLSTSPICVLGRLGGEQMLGRKAGIGIEAVPLGRRGRQQRPQLLPHLAEFGQGPVKAMKQVGQVRVRHGLVSGSVEYFSPTMRALF